MIINILAFANSKSDNFEPKICSGKKLNINPQMAANAAKILKRVKNIPFKEASFSLLLQDFAKKRTYAPVNPKLNKLK